MANGKSERKKQKREERRETLKRVLTFFLAILIVLIIAYYKTEFGIEDEETQKDITNEIQTAEGELILTMIDVGQADSFLFIQDGKTALVDCGTRSSGEDVVEYLNSIGITKLDYVFGTHPHDDHMGGMYDVITNFEIGTIIIPEVEKGVVTANWYITLMDEIKTNDYNVEYVEVGDIYMLGQAEMKVVGPITKFPSNTNNYSTVLKVSFGEMDVIMTGDAETQVEEEILASGENIDAEILKLGHHGSDTSTSEEFLDAISPEYALISAGLGNKHEHPIECVMQRLEERQIEVYRTDESGTVTVTITSNDITFDKEPGDYLDGVELEERENK